MLVYIKRSKIFCYTDDKKPSQPFNSFLPFGVIVHNVILIGLWFLLTFGISFPSKCHFFSTCSLKNAPDVLKIFPVERKNLQGTVVLYKNPISILIISNALLLPHIISDIVTNLCLLFSTCSLASCTASYKYHILFDSDILYRLKDIL